MTLVENFQYRGHSPNDPVSVPQKELIDRLAEERGLDPDELVVEEFGIQGVGGVVDLTKHQASETIEYLMSLPNPNRRGGY